MPYSLDLRERVVAAVEKGGVSARRALHIKVQDLMPLITRRPPHQGPIAAKVRSPPTSAPLPKFVIHRGTL